MSTATATKAVATARAVGWVEQGLVPDRVVRLGIRRLLKERLAEMRATDAEAAEDMNQAFIAHMREAPIALLPDKANEQHYEVPAEFFASTLGPHRKYSSCFWGAGARTLAQAEACATGRTSSSWAVAGVR
jgi:cyclopropane-fatty-acyl-phospholipid synthase